MLCRSCVAPAKAPRSLHSDCDRRVQRRKGIKIARVYGIDPLHVRGLDLLTRLLIEFLSKHLVSHQASDQYRYHKRCKKAHCHSPSYAAYSSQKTERTYTPTNSRRSACNRVMWVNMRPCGAPS